MSVFTITILSEGKKVDAPYVLKAVDVFQEVNRLPHARLVFVDGNPALQEFKLSNTDFFIPGKEIEIKIRYEEDANSENTIFKGIITKQAVEADVYASSLELELKDKAVKMTTLPQNKVYVAQEESDIFRQLIEGNGLNAGDITANTGELEEIVQYHVCDWDFLLTRADISGLWVVCSDGTISVVDPSTIQTANAQHRFSHGIDNILSFHLEIDAEQQLTQVSSTAWDLAENNLTPASQANNFELGLGNLKANELASAVGGTEWQLQSIIPLTGAELQAWANAKLRKSRFAMMKGTLTVKGIPNINLLEVIEIAGVSDRFNGNTIISGIRHRITEDGWFTDVQFGMSAEWYADRIKDMNTTSSNLLPAIQGIHIGVVDAFEADPNELFRLRVQIPAFGADAPSIWARLLSLEAGNGRGFFFRPEVGDEVVVGFLDNDSRQAIVLGSLFGSKQLPPVPNEEITEDNFIKGFFSREGIQIKMDDEKKALHFITSENQSITLDEDAQSIEIKDVNENSILMDADGITIRSAKNIVIEASDNVEIKGSKVDVK